MLFFVLLACVFLLFTSFKEVRAAYVWAISTLFLFVLVTTEMLSLFEALNYKWLAGIYAGALAICGYFIFKNFSNIISSLLRIGGRLKANVYFFIPIALMALILLFLAVYAAPNNWDSMTYHLGRMVHWVQHQHVNHYPTHILRQIHNPPLAEYVLTHIYLLTGEKDYFLNVLQWLMYVGCIVWVSLIVQALGAKERTQWVAAIFCATLPMAILQATNTKNELSVAFFALGATISLIFSLKDTSFQKHLYAAAFFTGLAMAVKSTAYVYLLPVWGVYGTAILLKNTTLKTLGSFAVAAIVIIALNITVFYRNFDTYGHLLGGNETVRSWYTNQALGAKGVISNVVKNVYLHLSNVQLWDDEPFFYSVADFFRYKLFKFHHWLGYDIYNSTTAWAHDYSFNLARDEDYAGNFLHFIWILGTLVGGLFVYKKVGKEVWLLVLTVTLMALFFCVYLKWQPWHTRLHLPYFMLMCVAMAIVLSCFKRYWKVVAAVLLTAGSVTYVVENNSKILLFKKPTVFEKSCDDVMFTKMGEGLKKDLYTLSEMFKVRSVQSVGLIVDGDAWDYPIYKILKRNNPELYIYHVNVKPFDTPQKVLERYSYPVPDAVLVDFSCADSVVNVLGKKFENTAYAGEKLRLFF